MITPYAALPIDPPGEPAPPWPDPDPGEWCCKNAHAHPIQQCPELLALLFAPELTDRIIAKVLDRLAHPHPCASCGDLTCADICAACQQVDGWGISLDLRARIRADAQRREVVDGVLSVF